MNVCLIGDSVFANRAVLDEVYGPAQKDLVKSTVQHLEDVLVSFEGSALTCLAVAGSTLSDVLMDQVPAIPLEATHVLVSAGGNDMIQSMKWLFGVSPNTIHKAGQLNVHPTNMLRLGDALYHGMMVLLQGLMERVPTAKILVCIPYIPDAARWRMPRKMVELFVRHHTAFLKEATYLMGVASLDLSCVVTNPSVQLIKRVDPSESGGQAIADAIGKCLVDMQ